MMFNPFNLITTTKALVQKTALSLSIVAIATTSATAGWSLEWIDRFDGDSVNWDNWTAQIQANYNNEVQCYTNDDSSANKNYHVENGVLKIIARKQQINCPGLGGAAKSWTSGRLNSKDKAEFLYGRIEARIKFNNLEGGTWPAFWALENRIAEHPKKNDNDFSHWPTPGAGEIDIWEWFSNVPNTYITNFFNTNSCGSEVRYNYPGGASDVLQWHRYAMEWDENSVKFFIDDILVTSQDISACAQYKEPMFVLINVAMGGNLGGSIDPNLTMATMEVDYVAHCQKDSTNSATYCDESLTLNEEDEISNDQDNDGVEDDADNCPNTPANSNVDADGCVIADRPNEAPVAAASVASDEIIPGKNVQLSADGSTDPENDVLFYAWQQASGTNVELLNHTSVSPTFKAPEVNNEETLVFQLEVSDGNLTDTTAVSVIIPASQSDDSVESTDNTVNENNNSGSSSGSLSFMLLLSAGLLLLNKNRILKL
ncbi:family 16 glycosylhydrolase [Thalassotalea crassostreae]|uniref:family 16 glycosylhydrolase n=1 Tax=Thalassotalea crassostreae TaxID=1763536 RepID=UPI0009ED521D|nr:family 16 glycosylhydrolase [Thalassotalea crassostreae]